MHSIVKFTIQSCQALNFKYFKVSNFGSSMGVFFKKSISRPNSRLLPIACHTYSVSYCCKDPETMLVHPLMHQTFANVVRLRCNLFIALCSRSIHNSHSHLNIFSILVVCTTGSQQPTTCW